MDTPTEKQLELQLEQARTERLAAEQRTAEAQARTAEIAESTKRERFNQEFKKRIAAAGHLFVMPHDELLQVLEITEKLKFDVSQSGAFSVSVGDKDKDFETLLDNFATKYPNLVDDRSSYSRRRKQEVEQLPLSKASFPTAAEKAKAISKFGLRWWTSLPLTSTPNVSENQMTAAHWRQLPLSEKSKLISKFGESYVAEVMKRK